MKYRQLTKEQLESLHKEFAQFLATQKIDAVQWQKMKSENSSLVEEELNLFSDMVWDDVLSKVEYLEHFSDNSVNFFKCEKEAIYRIVITINNNNIDLLSEKGFTNSAFICPEILSKPLTTLPEPLVICILSTQVPGINDNPYT